MLIDGEKFACDACIRGHRIDLYSISTRKAARFHNAPTVVAFANLVLLMSNAIVVRRAILRVSVLMEIGMTPMVSNATTKIKHWPLMIFPADQHGCGGCCSHGGRCSCALKKEHLDPVPELESPSSSPTSSVETRKPRLTSAQSESSLTVFANGHHKPVHKHNNMAHKCGVPYKIPRPHTIHGESGLAYRSVDNLHLSNAYDPKQSPSPISDSILSAQQDVRLVKSEHGSPEIRGASNLDKLNGQLTPLDLTFPSHDNATLSQSLSGMASLSASSLDNYYSTPDLEQPMFSAGLSMPSVDWSAFDFPLESGAFATAYSQPPSYASFDYSNIGQPALTTSSSGEISEVEDFNPFGGPGPLNAPNLAQNQVTSDTSEVCESDMHRLSTASSYTGLPQASILSSHNLEGLNIDDFLNGTTPSIGSFDEYSTRIRSNSEGYMANGYSLSNSRKIAPTSAPTDDIDVDIAIPTPSDNMDPFWATTFNDGTNLLDSETDVPDTVWMS
ncbi:MAG: hypothetical protein M1827_007609 [Pycnora praestabilis]|nr:MAG: hypothetical protein M1827_007609 [Pycnora praestabilis]